MPCSVSYFPAFCIHLFAQSITQSSEPDNSWLLDLQFDFPIPPGKYYSSYRWSNFWPTYGGNIFQKIHSLSLNNMDISWILSYDPKGDRQKDVNSVPKYGASGRWFLYHSKNLDRTGAKTSENYPFSGTPGVKNAIKQTYFVSSGCFPNVNRLKISHCRMSKQTLILLVRYG